MQLTPEQKSDLEQLKKHAWFKVLQLIEKEANYELFERLATFDIDDEENKKIIKRYQTYQTARNDFFQNIDNHLREVFVNKIHWIDYD